MDDFSTRLQELLDYLNLKPVTLAEEMGVQRTSFNHLLSGRNKPGFEFLYKLHTCYPYINLNWLISGVGTITENTDLKISQAEKSIPQTQSGSDLFSNIFINPPVNTAGITSSSLNTNDSTLPGKEPPTTIKTKEVTDEEEIDRLIIVYKTGKMVEVKK